MNDRAALQYEPSFLDQIKFACIGQKLNDVGDAAIGMLMNVVIQKTDNKKQALHYLGLTCLKMAEVIDRDYADIVASMETFEEQ